MVKTIEVKKWKEQLFDGKEIKEQEVNTLNMLSLLINVKHPDTMPKGMDGFRTFNRIAKAFDEAEKTGKLVLDDIDYKFLKELVEKEIPSSWGKSKDIVEAVEAFFNV